MTTLKPSSPVHCLLAIASVLCAAEQTRAEEKPRPPNIVIIYADDLGYGDLGCYGNRTIRTPNLDRMAKEGVRFTDFYVAQAVCSASRTALLTGCYPNRVGILGALGPEQQNRHQRQRDHVAEMLKAHGYATAIYGKWHLGHHPQFLPTRHGFDDYYGLPYSNDMWPQHPTQKFPPLPLIAGDKIIQTNPDQSMLTQAYTETRRRTSSRTDKDRPFFLYVPHTMPHVPIFASEGRKGKSQGGALWRRDRGNGRFGRVRSWRPSRNTAWTSRHWSCLHRTMGPGCPTATMPARRGRCGKERRPRSRAASVSRSSRAGLDASPRAGCARSRP